MTDDVLTMSGQLTVRDAPLQLSQGVVATVKIVDSGGEVLGAVAVAADQLPVTWQIAIDPAIIESPRGLLVWAALRTDPDNWWGTMELVSADDSEVELTRVPD